MPETHPSSIAQGAVFLSYASQDAGAARKICETLRAAGVTVWFDQEGGLEHGDEWDAKIRRQIKECVLFLPIVSANTEARDEGYFRIEWELATDRAMGIASGVTFILPIVIDDTREATALVPERFRKVQWTRLPGGHVPDDVRARFLKLWSHRTGVLAHQAATVAPENPSTPAQTPSATPRRSSWIGWAAALIVAVAAIGWWQPWRNHAPAVPLVTGTTTSAAAIGALPPAAAAPAAADEKSVAVLAFTNLSEDKDNEYFSDGISEELLSVLQKIPGLHVAARTSAFSFKGKNATAQEIGQKLGVARLVEGSVQKSGARVKVTARLSRVANGEEVWSHSYTREMKDVFALQEELALAIVSELRGQLSGEPPAQVITQVAAARKGGTQNLEAYQSYLLGRFLLAQFTQAKFAPALAALQHAVELDPSFALAWAELAQNYTVIAGFSDRLTLAEFDRNVAAARAAVDRALALEPDLPEALNERARVLMSFYFDWNGAKAAADAAVKLEPGNADFLTNSANLASARGDIAGSVLLLRQSLALDPVNFATRAYLAFTLIWAGQLAESREEYARLQTVNPAGPWVHAGMGLSLVLEGKYAEADTINKLESADYSRLLVLSLIRWGQGQPAASDAALNELITTEADGAAYQIAEAYGFRGQSDPAFQWLERARRQRDSGLGSLLSDPLLQKITGDPRWPTFLRTVGLAADQLK